MNTHTHTQRLRWNDQRKKNENKYQIKSNSVYLMLLKDVILEKIETRTTITRVDAVCGAWYGVYFVCLHHRNDFSVYKYCVYTIEYPNHPSIDGVTVCVCVCSCYVIIIYICTHVDRQTHTHIFARAIF